MTQDYLLFPELNDLHQNTEVIVVRKRTKRMDYYLSNLTHNRLKRQGTDATQLQKKKGLLPLEAYCIKCKVWCNKSILQYHHVNENFTYAVIPICPKCNKKMERSKIQSEIEMLDGQIYIEKLFYYEIDRSEWDIRIYESAARSMNKGGISYNHTEKLVINY